MQPALTISEFYKAIGISEAGYHNIPDDLKPRRVKLGRRVLITEPPAAYLARIAELGGIPSRKQKKAA